MASRPIWIRTSGDGGAEFEPESSVPTTLALPSELTPHPRNNQQIHILSINKQANHYSTVVLLYVIVQFMPGCISDLG